MKDFSPVQGFSINDKSALIVGCGGLGCNIAVHLVGSGIGKLYICDFDTVSESNLNRQFLYTEKDIGKEKCFLMKERLLAFSPDTVINCRNIKIERVEDLFFAEDADIVISAVDNAHARRILTQFCKNNSIPLVCGGIDGFFGTAYLYIPGTTPCPDCAGMNENSRAKYNVSSTAGIIGSYQAGLAVRYLLTKDSSLGGKLTVYDEYQIETLNIKKRENCENQCL